jgi:hypothetical protein
MLIGQPNNQINSIFKALVELKNINSKKDFVLSKAYAPLFLDNAIYRDSLFSIVINDCNTDKTADIKYELVSKYFEIYTDQLNPEFAKFYLSKAQEANQSDNICLANLAMFNSVNFGNENYLNQAIYYNNLTKNKSIKIRTLIAWGNDLEQKNKKIDAFRLYSEALLSSKILGDENLIRFAEQNLIMYYAGSNNTEKANEIVFNQIENLNSHAPFDSFKYAKTLSWQNFVFDDTSNIPAFVKNSAFVIDYANRNNLDKLLKDELDIFRTNCVERNDFNAIRNFYKINNPNYLYKHLLDGDTLTYFKIQVCIFEQEKNKDSTIYYLNKLEQFLVHGQHNKFQTANFYKRKGAYYLRCGNVSEAIDAFEISNNLSTSLGYTKWIIETSNLLSKLYYQQNNLQKAYSYMFKYANYKDSLAVIENKDKQLKIEIENENKLQLFELEKTKTMHERKMNILYSIVTMILCFFCAMLIILSGVNNSKKIIRAIAYISFIFLFETIIMVFENWIHHFTHGEAWKMLLFKIGLISILLPFHHWIEHKVIHYLYENRLVDIQKIKSFIASTFTRKKEVIIENKPIDENATPDNNNI